MSFVLSSGARRGATERQLLALVQLLMKVEWPNLESVVVASVPDSLTSPEGPPADDEGAVALGRMAAWLCLLHSNRAELLQMLAEILGRGGPRTAPACFGVLQVWPAVLGSENLSSCICFCIEQVVDSKDDDVSKKLMKCLEVGSYLHDIFNFFDIISHMHLKNCLKLKLQYIFSSNL